MNGRIVRIGLMPGFLLIGLIVGGVVPRIAAQTAATTLEAPKWTMGDHWTWRRGGDVVTATVVDASAGYLVMEKDGADASFYHYAPDLSSTDSHFTQLQFPMSVGDEWRYTIERPDKKQSAKWIIGRRVEAMDSVTIPAGTFDTFRVAGRHCNVALNVCGDFVAWYAPQVKNVVKITWTASNYWPPDLRGMSQVLLSYGVRAP